TSGPWLHRPGYSVRLDSHEKLLAERLIPLIVDGGFDPPWVRDLAARTGRNEEEVRLLLRKLVRQGTLFQVVKDLFYHEKIMDRLANVFKELAATSDGVRAARYRDATGLGRKRSIQLLEYFGRIGYTRRIGDKHVLRSGCTLFQ